MRCVILLFSPRYDGFLNPLQIIDEMKHKRILTIRIKEPPIVFNEIDKFFIFKLVGVKFESIEGLPLIF
jgi:hypothetical protein